MTMALLAIVGFAVLGMVLSQARRRRMAQSLTDADTAPPSEEQADLQAQMQALLTDLDRQGGLTAVSRARGDLSIAPDPAPIGERTFVPVTAADAAIPLQNEAAKALDTIETSVIEGFDPDQDVLVIESDTSAKDREAEITVFQADDGQTSVVFLDGKEIARLQSSGAQPTPDNLRIVVKAA